MTLFFAMSKKCASHLGLKLRYMSVLSFPFPKAFPGGLDAQEKGLVHWQSCVESGSSVVFLTDSLTFRCQYHLQPLCSTDSFCHPQLAIMKSSFVSHFLALCTVACLVAAQSECSSPMICKSTTSPPTLDGDLSDWANVTGIDIQLTNITGSVYEPGNLTAKCLYDSTNFYLAMEVPGAYLYDATTDELCAAIGMMMKIGQEATFVNMGGCPDAANGCINGVPDTCNSYLVDIGAHWQLPSTQQGVVYTISDESAVHAYCRTDDENIGGGNEWSGAWVHSNNSTTVEDGAYYVFELSRPLKTGSATTDSQLAAGDTYEFGLAFWDPNQTVDGWSDNGHYVTGCAEQWMNLVLEADGGAGGGGSTTTSDATTAMTAVAKMSLLVLLLPLF